MVVSLVGYDDRIKARLVRDRSPCLLATHTKPPRETYGLEHHGRGEKRRDEIAASYLRKSGPEGGEGTGASPARHGL